MSRDELERINDAIYNAEMGLDKFGRNSAQGKMFAAEIERLKAEKAALEGEQNDKDNDREST